MHDHLAMGSQRQLEAARGSLLREPFCFEVIDNRAVSKGSWLDHVIRFFGTGAAMKMEFNPTIGNVIARRDFEGNLALAVHLSLAAVRATQTYRCKSSLLIERLKVL